MPPVKPWLPLLLCCLPCGCCSISQGLTALFCGPSEEPWATVSYRTSAEALKTFQAAIAREDVDIIYKSLSKDLKRRWGVGRLEAEVAWAQIKKQQPGIHVVGLARIVATPPSQDPTVVEHDLEVAGQQFRVRLKRYNYWSVVVADEDGPIPYGDYVPRLSPKHLRIRRVGNTSAVQAHIPEVEIPRLRLEDVIEVTVGREWKVDGFGPVPKTSPPKT